MPGQQLGHEGDAGPLVPLGPTRNRLEERNWLSSSLEPGCPLLTDTEPVFEFVMSQSSLTELSN